MSHEAGALFCSCQVDDYVNRQPASKRRNMFAEITGPSDDDEDDGPRLPG